MSQVLVVVYFIYGLAFFGMGIAMALETGRSPALVEARVLRPLAAFGLLHGTHEWLESYLLQAAWLGTSMPLWLPSLRLSILIISFIFLFIFAQRLLLLNSPQFGKDHTARYGIVVLYGVLVLLSGYMGYRELQVPWIALIDGLARYLLAVPASILASRALFVRNQQARAEGILQKYFFLASFGFAVYGLSQFFVQPLEMFPANIINQQTFMAFTGFPVQIVRTCMAALVAISLLKTAQLMEAERNTQWASMQRSRLEALQQRETLRRNLLRQCVRAQEDERARIARELHDETSQTLSAFALELGTVRTLLKNNKSLTLKVEHLQDLSREISQGLYRLMGDLRPAQLDDLGLVPAIKFLLEQETSASGVRTSIKLVGEPRRIDPLVETVLFRVAQEAINNIVRHAGTSEAQLRLTFEAKQVYLTIADAGIGFDAGTSFTAPRGWGLAGMRERVESVGGTFNLESSPGLGTLVSAVIPLNGRSGDQNG